VSAVWPSRQARPTWPRHFCADVEKVEAGSTRAQLTLKLRLLMADPLG